VVGEDADVTGHAGGERVSTSWSRQNEVLNELWIGQVQMLIGFPGAVLILRKASR
jgi:hypothetical protein